MTIKKAALFSLALGLASCSLYGVEGNGETQTRAMQVSGFDEVRTHGSLDLRVESSQSQKVLVTCDSNLFEYIEVFRDGSALVIDQSESLNPRGRCAVTVRTPTLASIKTTGSGDVTSVGHLPGLTSIRTTGSGDMIIEDIAADALNVRTTGSGDVALFGDADILELESTGSGDVFTSDLVAGHVEAKTTGSGDLSIHANESIRVRSTGSGDVDVWGNPEERDVDSSGSGDIDFR